MKVIAFVIFVVSLSFVIRFNTFSQINYSSVRFDYSIQVPKGFQTTEITGENVDFKCVSAQGDAVIMIDVREIKGDEKYTLGDLGLDKITPEKWEEQLSRKLPEPRFVKSGSTNLGKLPAFFIHITAKPDNESIVYNIFYYTIYDNRIITISAACNENSLPLYNGKFFSTIQSFKISD